MEIGLSLGSNLGDRLRRLADARDRIAALPGTRIVAASPVYETQPVDVAAEFAADLFLNAVLVIETPVPPHALARQAHAIEADIGRVRVADRNAPRPIDIDLVYAGDLVIRDDELTIPHPRWAERRFVLQPLADVRPDLRLPGAAGTVAEALAALQDKMSVALYTRTW